MWEYIEVEIGEVKNLLSEYDIEVSSPDGWVPVNYFVDKGKWDEYILGTADGKIIRCNENHLFETLGGWKYAKDLVGKNEYFLTENSDYILGHVIKTNNKIDIVDISVEHDNHRYYTDGISSHNTGTGKSMMMCSLAADYISMGYDVLYITLEMSEEKISHRIDANLLDIELNSLKSIPRDTYLRKFEEFKQAGYGKLIVKEYPTSSASCANFRFLLQELDIKQSFKPKIVFLDYLGITLSSRFKSSENMYQIQKSVAEEFRGLAVEMDFVAWTATQINRGANGKSEIALGDISESFGINMSCDMVLGLTSTPELVAMNQLKIEQLKNRYTDLNYNSTKLLDVVRAKMRIYDNGRETIPYKKVKSTKFDNTLNKIESDDKPFVFDKSMIRPKKEYTKFNLE